MYVAELFVCFFLCGLFVFFFLFVRLVLLSRIFILSLQLYFAWARFTVLNLSTRTLHANRNTKPRILLHSMHPPEQIDRATDPCFGSNSTIAMCNSSNNNDNPGLSSLQSPPCSPRSHADSAVARPQSASVIAWIDIEGGGLEVDRADLLEFAMVITSDDLETVLEEYHCPVRLDESRLTLLSEWSRQHHAMHAPAFEDSLLRECLYGAHARTGKEIDYHASNLLDKHSDGLPVILAGSALAYDRAMLVKHLPMVASRLHYRTMDVSCVMEMSNRWIPNRRWPRRPKPSTSHRAIEDIWASLSLMRFYKKWLFSSDDDNDDDDGRVDTQHNQGPCFVSKVDSGGTTYFFQSGALSAGVIPPAAKTMTLTPTATCNNNQSYAELPDHHTKSFYTVMQSIPVAVRSPRKPATYAETVKKEPLKGHFVWHKDSGSFAYFNPYQNDVVLDQSIKTVRALSLPNQVLFVS